MKKVTFRIDEERYEDLRVLVANSGGNVSDAIREAIEVAFEDQLDAIAMEREMEEYQREPTSFVIWDEFKKSRGLETPVSGEDKESL